MSSLTEQERLGLEEVFLSISSKGKARKGLYLIKDKLLFCIPSPLFSDTVKKPVLTLKCACKGLKKPNFRHLLTKRSKKKKNLR